MLHLLCIGAKDQPALVDGAAGDADLLALQVGKAFRRAVRRHHQAADRTRIGNEDEVAAGGPLPRHPKPVGDNDVHLASGKRNLGGRSAGNIQHLHGKAVRRVETVVTDRIDFPVHGARKLERGAHNDRLCKRRQAGQNRGKCCRDERFQDCHGLSSPCFRDATRLHHGPIYDLLGVPKDIGVSALRPRSNSSVARVSR